MKNFIAYSLIAFACCIPAAGAFAQAGTAAQRISDLEQDVQALKETVGQLNMQMEELRRTNDTLRGQLGKSTQQNADNYVTISQLDSQLTNLRAEMMRAQSTQKDEIIDEVSRQIERLAQQTQQALQTQAVAQAPANAPSSSFSDNFPKTGVSYTVQPGDSLTRIARRLNSSLDDIRNANRISDPSKVKVGQVLFIPQKSPASAAKK
jgi:LysM repeat protein